MDMERLLRYSYMKKARHISAGIIFCYLMGEKKKEWEELHSLLLVHAKQNSGRIHKQQ